jgi:hypothetical protein
MNDDDLFRVRAREAIAVSDITDEIFAMAGVVPDEQTHLKISPHTLEVRRRATQPSPLDVGEVVGKLCKRIGISPDLIREIELAPDRWLVVHAYKRDEDGCTYIDPKTNMVAETVTEFIIDTAKSTRAFEEE